jgi:putative Mg2+ transporter-C (MgtC) family protein
VTALIDPSIPLRLLLAAVLGGVIGIERQIREKPAGLRTNIMICVGSALFMNVSAKAAELLGGDPMRIAAQIVSGIGFLGAGAVLHSHGFVLGLTTAATIWVVAGVGMALGAGMYAVAVFVTAMSLIILYCLGFLEERLQSRRSYTYDLVVTDLNVALASITKVLEESSVSAASFNFKKRTGHYQVGFNLLVPHDTNLKIFKRLSEVPEITQVETGNAPGTSWHSEHGDAGGRFG